MLIISLYNRLFYKYSVQLTFCLITYGDFVDEFEELFNILQNIKKSLFFTVFFDSYYLKGTWIVILLKSRRISHEIMKIKKKKRKNRLKLHTSYKSSLLYFNIPQ